MYNGYVLAVDVCAAVNEPILPPWEQLEIGNLLSQQPAVLVVLGEMQSSRGCQLRNLNCSSAQTFVSTTSTHSFKQDELRMCISHFLIVAKNCILGIYISFQCTATKSSANAPVLCKHALRPGTLCTFLTVRVIR